MFFVTEEHTKLRLLMLIKKSGGMSVKELSRHIGITPMGVRQHLISLEKKGIVRYTTKKHGRGRPKFLYMLTEKGETVFPNSYNKIATDILRFLREIDGKVKVDKLFKMRKERFLAEKGGSLPDRTRLSERVSAMAEMLNMDGYLVELEETEKSFLLKKYHCPISEIAQEFEDPCKHELELYREIFNKGVLRENWQAAGDLSCTYIIPKVTLVRPV
ncbi:MAG: transcriptional regulator [Thermodesulfovibrionales bacterium]|nr:transcriptional regulator [Thermodesulfovibrionales bacterium]